MKQPRVPFDVRDYVRKSTTGPCFICEFLSGNARYSHVFVDETHDAVAFLNAYPTLFGYVLVAPKRHVEEVTGSFTHQEYLDLQSFVYRVSEAIQRVLQPERTYIMSLGSKAANSHVHWHIAPLPKGVPLQEQQYHALMHENGVIATSADEMHEYANHVRSLLHNSPDGSG